MILMFSLIAEIVSYWDQSTKTAIFRIMHKYWALNLIMHKYAMGSSSNWPRATSLMHCHFLLDNLGMR